jgi:fructose-bisphosphate aldolase/6-deoxy-5-ketofructose 1-phosphate synthase
MITKECPVPLTVPEKSREIFCQNYAKATHNTGRLFLFAGDQKIEHLNKDFYGAGIDSEDANPQHLFEIASRARIGVFATNLGLVARYASNYRNIRYMIKLNGKSDLVSIKQAEPRSRCLTTVQQVVDFKRNTGLDIVGIGITVYLGSEYESEMLVAAANAIIEAHQHGLITTVWMYPRGKSVIAEKNAEIIAGAAGVAVCLGADFVKVNPPEASDSAESARLLVQATQAAGNTKVICSGGGKKQETDLLKEVFEQISIGGAQGAAIGRNIHQKNLHDAIKLCNALAAIIIDSVDVITASKILQ